MASPVPTADDDSGRSTHLRHVDANRRRPLASWETEANGLSPQWMAFVAAFINFIKLLITMAIGIVHYGQF